jgi:uncharacterized ion transporter superfamily protein YfcC
MNNSQITDTVLHAMESAAESAGSGIFAVVIFLINLPLAFLIPSTSGHAASGWINLITPTSAVVMGGIALAKVGYDRFIRFMAPLMAILFVLTVVFLALGAAFS